jgi:dienelactone hydrolase
VIALLALVLVLAATPAPAEVSQRVVDVASRTGVTQRFLLVDPGRPKAAAILFAGGHGGLQLTADGDFGWGKGNFLVRSRDLFVEQGLLVAVVDAPSDRQSPPFLSGFRQTHWHVSDVKAVIAWLRQHAPVPVWLVGTSRGTQSAAFIGTEAAPDRGGPDGIVLTASVLRDPRGRAVPEMPLEKIGVPVLVVHHKQDGCVACPFDDVPRVMARLTSARARELLAFDGGVTRGDPCEAFAHHGFNGLERDVVSRIAHWMLAR